MIEDRLIREAECRNLTGLSRSTRWRLERDGLFPQRRQISENAVAWMASELNDWIKSKSESPVAHST
ncbi:MAG: AlpA family phage regulatory protein [Bacteroidetes bacterium]|nr:AlpA family phage regulatory protein [Bacteroidota bacterium]